MKKLSVLVLAFLCLIAVGAKPYHSMVVTYEDVSYGYEGDRYDGILGADETLYWVAEGQLEPNEQFVYTYLPSSASRLILVRAFTLRGKGVLLIEIVAIVHTNIGDLVISNSGIGEACLEVPGYRPNTADWKVTITNVGSRNAKGIYSSGINRTNFGQRCD